MALKRFFLISITSFLIFFGCDIKYNLTDYLGINSKNKGGGIKSWKAIGAPGFSSYPPYKLELKINNSGTPSVGYIITPYNQYVYFHVFNGSWNEYDCTFTSVLDGEMAMSIISNEPSVFGDNFNGSIWHYNAGWTSFPIPVIGSYPEAISLMDYNGYPCIGYYFSTSFVIKDFTGSAWNSYAFSPGFIINKSQIQYKAGNIFLSYSAAVGGVFMKYVNTGIENLDTASPVTIDSNSTTTVFSMSVASNGIAYILFSHTTDNNILHFTSYNGVTVSGSVFPDLTLTQIADNPSMIVVNESCVYVVFAEGSVNPIIKAYLFNGTEWTQFGEDIGQGYTGISPSVDIAPNGNLFVAYSDNNTGGRITVKSYR